MVPSPIRYPVVVRSVPDIDLIVSRLVSCLGTGGVYATLSVLPTGGDCHNHFAPPPCQHQRWDTRCSALAR